MTTTAQLIAAEKSRALAAEQKLSDRIAKLEAAHPATVPVPPAPLPAPSPPTGQPLTSAPTPASQPPAVGQSIVEAGVRVTCISKTTRHAYASIQPENADGSRILLGFSPGSAQLLDGTTYKLLATFQVPSYALWSNTDPNLIYGADQNRLVKQDVRPGPDGKRPFVTVATFPSTVSIGNFEGGISDDDRYLALTSAGRLVVFDLVTGQTVGNIVAPVMDSFQISRDGSSVVVRGGNTRVYSRDLTTSRELYPYANHGDNWIGAYIANNCPAVKSFALAAGTAKTLIPAGSAFANGHSSGRGPLPVFSSYDPIGMKDLPGCDQIVAVNPDGTVIPFGWSHRSITKAYIAMTKAEKDVAYPGEPHAVPSRDGRRVVFASDWGGSLGCYVAERIA